MNHPIKNHVIRNSTGEELLLIAVFGSGELKRKVDRELDRRAHQRLGFKPRRHEMRRAA